MQTASSGWAEQLRQRIQRTALKSISSLESCRQCHCCVRKPGETHPGTQGADVEAISWGQIPPAPARATGRVPVLQARSPPGHCPSPQQVMPPVANSWWSFPADCLCWQPGPTGAPAPWEVSHLGGCHTSAAAAGSYSCRQRSQSVCSSLTAHSLRVALGWVGEEWSSQCKLSGVT